MTRSEQRRIQKRAARRLEEAGVVLTDREREEIEVADFGLDRFETEGLALHVYVNNDRYCGKELVMEPGQTCPEHRHPPVDGDPGKRETLRCRTGRVRIYLARTPGRPAEPTPGSRGDRAAVEAEVPEPSRDYYTVFREILLEPGRQVTVPPDTLHWFQAGPEGAVITEFSSTSRDELDVFTDPNVRRAPEIKEE